MYIANDTQFESGRAGGYQAPSGGGKHALVNQRIDLNETFQVKPTGHPTGTIQVPDRHQNIHTGSSLWHGTGRKYRDIGQTKDILTNQRARYG